MRALLFLCRENACRSQMAEGLAREILRDRVVVFSAGSTPRGSVDPLAIEVMREIGIDITGQASKSLDAVPPDAIDGVITLCAEEECPVFPGDVERLHWPIPDPAAEMGEEESVRAVYRATRDELDRRIRRLAGGLTDSPTPGPGRRGPV